MPTRLDMMIEIRAASDKVQLGQRDYEIDDLPIIKRELMQDIEEVTGRLRLTSTAIAYNKRMPVTS